MGKRNTNYQPSPNQLIAFRSLAIRCFIQAGILSIVIIPILVINILILINSPMNLPLITMLIIVTGIFLLLLTCSFYIITILIKGMRKNNIYFKDLRKNKINYLKTTAQVIPAVRNNIPVTGDTAGPGANIKNKKNNPQKTAKLSKSSNELNF